MILATQKADRIVQKCKEILSSHYGNKFRGLVVYGSMARGTADRFSDIDMLVLIRKPLNFFKELRTITDLLYSVQLESGQLISAKPVAYDEFQKGRIQLYRNAKAEGILV